jgi:hypothetical protein
METPKIPPKTGYLGVLLLEGPGGDCRILLPHFGGALYESSLIPRAGPVSLTWTTKAVPEAPWMSIAASTDGSTILLATRQTEAVRHVANFAEVAKQAESAWRTRSETGTSRKQFKKRQHRGGGGRGGGGSRGNDNNNHEEPATGGMEGRK